LSTPDALAKSAREKLALALNALQTSPDPPVELLDLAEPIAQTMGILHRIERSRGQDLSGREHVVGNIRKALDVLQNFEASHPAVDAVMEQVAGCLSAAHQLSRMAAPSTPGTAPGLAPSPHAAAPAPAVAAPAPASPVAQMVANIPPPAPVVAAPAPVVAAPVVAAPVVAAPVVAAPVVAAPAPVVAAPVVAAPAPAVTAAPAFAPAMAATAPQTQPVAPSPTAAYQQIPPGAGHTLRMEANPALKAAIENQQRAAQPTQPLPQAPAGFPQQPYAAPQQAFPHAAQAPAQAAPAHAPAVQPATPQYAAPPAAAPAAQPAAAPKAAPSNRGQTGNVVVGLGAHSVSNFYKGLGGNDVIEYGGIFVSTYQIPKIGTPVSLYVKLPGDLEFQAAGVVQWIREASGDGVDPGFGARFTQITPEGRQLVYRYTRNREPILYDDL
jgi:hypothetical protein